MIHAKFNSHEDEESLKKQAIHVTYQDTTEVEVVESVAREEEPLMGCGGGEERRLKRFRGLAFVGEEKKKKG
jgi:hypothetical protein